MIYQFFSRTINGADSDVFTSSTTKNLLNYVPESYQPFSELCVALLLVGKEITFSFSSHSLVAHYRNSAKEKLPSNILYKMLLDSKAPMQQQAVTTSMYQNTIFSRHKWLFFAILFGTATTFWIYKHSFVAEQGTCDEDVGPPRPPSPPDGTALQIPTAMDAFDLAVKEIDSDSSDDDVPNLNRELSPRRPQNILYTGKELMALIKSMDSFDQLEPEQASLLLRYLVEVHHLDDFLLPYIATVSVINRKNKLSSYVGIPNEESYMDPISRQYMRIPVKFHDERYNLGTLLGMWCNGLPDPKTRKEINLANIASDREFIVRYDCFIADVVAHYLPPDFEELDDDELMLSSAASV